MRFLERFTVLVALLLALTPLVSSALVMEEREDMVNALQQAVHTAASRYRSGMGVRALQRQGEARLEAAHKLVTELAKQKRTVRLALRDARAEADRLQKEHNIDVRDEEGIAKRVRTEEKALGSFLRALSIRSLQRSDSLTSTHILRLIADSSVGEQTDALLQDRALQDARTQLFALLLSAQNTAEELRRAETQFTELDAKHQAALKEEKEAQELVQVSAQRQAEIRRIVVEVQNEILRLQSELARIDAQVRARAERTLIEKGLRAPRAEGEEQEKDSPDFTWPVYGPLSAYFRDGAYRKYFGVPHDAIDIVVPQASPVVSAADGVVFLVRDGGERGYSYILIGHKSGYATLYGHLSQFAVVAGQDVRKGEVIALSGGEPGTHGAGPMTTGAHVHFEVILGGAHVDPLSVLP